MPSRLVTEYGVAAQALIDALRERAGPARQGASEALGSMLAPGEHVPDVGLLAELIARRLEHDRAELERAEARAHGALGEDAALRAEAVQELHATLLEARRAASALLGTAWRDGVPAPRRLATGAVAELLQAAKATQRALRGRAAEPAIDGIQSVDARPWRKRIRTAVKNLAATCGATDTGDLDEAGRTLSDAVAQLEQSLAAAATVARGAMELAGRTDEALRLPSADPRRTHRRRRAPRSAPTREDEPHEPQGQ